MTRFKKEETKLIKCYPSNKKQTKKPVKYHINNHINGNLISLALTQLSYLEFLIVDSNCLTKIKHLKVSGTILKGLSIGTNN